MSALPKYVEVAESDVDPRLARYLWGNERDPADSFDLAAPVWPLCAYREASALARAHHVSFHGLGPLTPYIKWFVLERRLLAGGSASNAVAVVTAARRFAAAMTKEGIASFDALVSVDTFGSVWDDLITAPIPAAERTEGNVWRQTVLAPFFRATRIEFGIPLYVPRRAVFARPSIALHARRTDKAIPPAVVSSLVNRLALHRDDREILTPFDLLRLSVLVIHLTLGRRIAELLGADRGDGTEGPLVRYTAADGQPALGFRFAPNKGDARDDVVYISPAWEDVVGYAVGQVLRLSDPVRDKADPLSVGLFILVSPLASTINRTFVTSAAVAGGESRPAFRPRASALRYASFSRWINGHVLTGPGVMERWRVTASGDPGDPPYRLLTHGARHARASALAADPRVSRLAAARDLNHTSNDVVSIYQHGLEAQNAELRRKVGRVELVGLGARWVAEAAGGYLPGSPRLSEMDERFRGMLAAQPELLEFNRVPGGYCSRPQGPAACPEFLECAEATEEGCSWFATDPSDGQQLIELDDRAWRRRQEANEVAAGGKAVLAAKLEVLAERAERTRDVAVGAGPAEAIARLRAHVDARLQETN